MTNLDLVDAGLCALADIGYRLHDDRSIDIGEAVAAVEKLISVMEQAPPSPAAGFRVLSCDLAVAEREKWHAAITNWRADGSSDQLIEPARALYEAVLPRSSGPT
jgi:hypothetical protein